MYRKIIAFLLVVVLSLPYISVNTLAATNQSNSEGIVISAGDSFYVSLKKDGTVWSWGKNNYGQLGDGSDRDSVTPVQVKGLKDIIAISAGAEHALALQKDGTVWGWGSDRSFRVGRGSAEKIYLPVKVDRIEGAVDIAAGSFHTVVLKQDGTLIAWGYRVNGMLQVPDIEGAKSIATSGLVTYVVKDDGTVWRWALNRTPRELDGSDAFTAPTQVNGLADITEVSVSSGHLLALQKDGTVWAYGQNYKGQLGNGTDESADKPVKVMGLSNIISISAGEHHSLALSKDGTVWAWGSNDDGQIGRSVTREYTTSRDNRIVHYNTPQKVELKNAMAISAGKAQSFAMLSNGTVWGWGKNLNGVNPVTEAQSFVIEPRFESGGSFSDHVVYTGRSSFVDRTGKEVTRLPYNVFCSGMYSFNEGIASFCIPHEVSRTSVYGLMDKSGTEILKPQYSSIGAFHDGLASIHVNGKFGFIDRTGKEVIEPQYDAYGYEYRFSEGLLLAKKDGKFGFVDTSGKTVIPFNYDYARSFSDGLAAVSKNNKYGYINKAGKEVIKLKYEDAFPFGDGVAIVRSNHSWVLVDKAGKETKLNWNSYLGPYETYSNGMLKVERSGRYGFIDKKGKEVIKIQYSYLDRFQDGLALAAKEDSNNRRKYGFINKQGKEIIPFQYDLALPFSEGLAAVRKQGKWGFIDKSGKLVIQHQFSEVRSYSESLAAVKVNDKWGYIANPLDVPASWAVQELMEARANLLIPVSLDYGYAQNITRSDFSQLAVHLLTKVNSTTIERLLQEHGKTIKRDTFTDTANKAVLAAYELGILSGKGNGLFDPQGYITRQEAAVMLTNVAKLLGVKRGNPTTFKDDADIAGWAKGAVSYVSTLIDQTNQAAVMGGTGDNKFSPRGNFTRQQAMITMKRMFHAAGGINNSADTMIY